MESHIVRIGRKTHHPTPRKGLSTNLTIIFSTFHPNPKPKLQVKILVNGEERISPWASYVLQPPRENQVQPFCVWESILTSWRDLKAPPLLNTCGHQQKMWSTSFCTQDPPNRQVSGAVIGLSYLVRFPNPLDIFKGTLSIPSRICWWFLPPPQGVRVPCGHFKRGGQSQLL